MIKEYLLDTNICIFMLKQRYNVQDRIYDIGIEHCYISEITIAELFYGAFKSMNPLRGRNEVFQLMSDFEIISATDAIETFGQLKADMERSGNKIDDFDLLIGATAITHDLIMVTDNVKHLGKIPGIQLENWIERNK